MTAPSCSLLVVSCDRYQDLWAPFFNSLRRFWDQCPFPVFLGSETLQCPDPSVTTLLAGPNPWSNNLRYFLGQLDTTYVLLMLEDFFLNAPVSNQTVLGQLSALAALDGVSLRLKPDPHPTIRVPGRPDIGEIHRLAAFRVSLQASFWKREELLNLLRNGESPWVFEHQGTLRARTRSRGFYCSFKQTLPYQHGVERGIWFRSAARLYAGQSTRPVMGPWTAFRKAAMLHFRRARGRLLTLPLRSPEPDPFATPSVGDQPRVAFLTNLIPPYHKPVLLLLAQRFAAFRVFLSTPMEANRPWKVDWRGLDVVLQKTTTLHREWHHPRGFREPLEVHIPWDTLPQLRRFAPDVVISAEMGARTLFAILFRKLYPHTRLIVWAEAAESTEAGRGTLRQIARRFVVHNTDAFLAVGSSAVHYLSHIGAQPRAIFRIAYTADAAHFVPAPLSRPRRLLYCGQLIERKGLLPFLQALTRWALDHPAAQIEFALAGDGPLRQRLADLPLPGNVKLELLGVFQYADLPHIYASAGIFVLPTLADTWAVVVNEALLSGLPVLGSVYAQAVEELIQDGINGWVFQPDDAAKAYRAIDRMMTISDADLEAMRTGCRELASRITPERIASLIAEAVLSVRKER